MFAKVADDSARSLTNPRRFRVHREQARSYRGVDVGYKAFILDIAPSGA